MTKAELIARVDDLSRRRYGTRFSAALFADLLKDGLVLPARRIGNEGRRGIFRYDARAYRRALQIARMRSHGVRNRDAIRLQLFARGYGIQPHEVRSALFSEYQKAIKTAFAKVRSRYLDSSAPVPPGRLQSLVASIGPLDPSLANAQLELSPATMVALLRAARNQPLSTSELRADASELAHVLQASEPFAAFAELMGHELSGMLLLDEPAQDGERAAADYVEALLAEVTDAELVKARDVTLAFVRIGRALADEKSAGHLLNPNLQRAIGNVVFSAMHHTWLPLILVLQLSWLRRIVGFEPIEQIADFFLASIRSGFTIPALLSMFRDVNSGRADAHDVLRKFAFPGTH